MWQSVFCDSSSRRNGFVYVVVVILIVVICFLDILDELNLFKSWVHIFAAIILGAFQLQTPFAKVYEGEKLYQISSELLTSADLRPVKI